MKKVVWISVLVVIVFALAWQFSNGSRDVTKAIPTQISFKQTEIDMGRLKQGIPKSVKFVCQNIGENYLIIQVVETSCGCTTPKWTTQPIQGGESGEIRMTYDAKYPGHFNKTITVYANVENSPVKLSISGQVLAGNSD